MTNKTPCVVFAGGGTGGHIFPGLAVAKALRSRVEKTTPLKIYWIGNCSRSVMDSTIIAREVETVDGFFGIPCGKLRRYFSLRNFTDIFKIMAGCIKSFFILRNLRPLCLFSKGGYVSVPPALCAKLLGIPIFTHECDFTPGLATRINSRWAKKILLSYEDTKKYFSTAFQNRLIVTGNPVREIFYSANALRGRSFLGLPTNSAASDKNIALNESSKNETLRDEKPILLVLGGSLGAAQLNTLVSENLEWLTARFIVVHQTGGAFKASPASDYYPYQFLHDELPDLMAAASIIVTRSGASSLWECAAVKKSMLLIPLCGAGTRGDQIDNARYFTSKNAACALIGDEATSDNMKAALIRLLDPATQTLYQNNISLLTSGEKSADKIVDAILKEIL